MNAKQIVGLHARLWEQKYGESLPISWQRSCIQANRLLKLYGHEKLADYIQYFFVSYSSKFADRSGHTFGVFIAELPAIIASFQQEQGKRGAVRTEDFERMDSARKSESLGAAARIEKE